MTFDAIWAWAALGLLLIVVEIGTSTFYALWFGLAAFVMALVAWLFPDTPFAVQLGGFALLSFSAVIVWRLNYTYTEPGSRIGQSKGDEIGRVGTIIAPCSATQNGTIRFTQGVMASREWVAFSNAPLEIGDFARIVAVEGNALRVEKAEALT